MLSRTHNSRRNQSSTAFRSTIETLENRQLLSASPTLWAADAQGRLFTVVPNTGQVHVIGNMPAVMFDIAFDGHGNLYGVDDNGGTAHLWKINTTNASATQVGSVGAFVNSLVFSPKGALYGAGSALYSINTTSGHGTQIGTGNLNGYSSAGDLAFDSTGTLYLSTTTNDLVKVNTATGAATKIGPIGFGYVYGLSFGSDGVLYGVSNTTQQVFSINRSTGHGTLLSSFANQGAVGVNGTAFPSEAVQHIEVDGNTMRIADGATTASTTNGTNFGGALANSASVTHTFTLINDTASTLNLTSTPRVTLTGANAADFTLVSALAASVAPFGSTNFQIKFTPHASGLRTATVTINNSNAADPHYHFVVQGTGGTLIYAADTTGELFTLNSATGQTHNIGKMPTVMYDIAFDKSGNLFGIDSGNGLWQINANNATATEIGVVGVNDNINSLTFGPDGYLYAAGTSLYKIDVVNDVFFTEGSLGGFTSAGDLAFDSTCNLYLSTTTNDLVKVNPTTGAATKIGPIGFSYVYGLAFGSDGILYGMSDTTQQVFAISRSTGQGTLLSSFANQGVVGINGAAFPVGHIDVDGNNLRIADGATTTSTADGTNFGGALANSDSVTHTFTLINDTASTLSLTGTPRVTISGANAADFTLVSAPAASVAPSGTTSFQIKFTPHGSGLRTATVTINTNNAADPNYQFVVQGTGGALIYGADTTGELFTLNSATGQTHNIGKMPTVMYDIAFDKSGNLFGIDSGNGLWQINANTAAASEIGVVGVNDNINSLTFGPDGYLYAAGTSLYKIDVANDVFFTEGSLGGYTSAGDLAFDKNGDLVMSTTSNQLVKVNPATAQTTLIGSIGFQFVYGLAESNDGILYGISTQTDQIFSINPITGQGSSPVTFTGVNGINGAAVKP